MKVNLFESQADTAIRLDIPEEQLKHVSVITYRKKTFTYSGFMGKFYNELRFDEVNETVDLSEYPDLA